MKTKIRRLDDKLSKYHHKRTSENGSGKGTKNTVKKLKVENRWKYHIPYKNHETILLVGEGNFSFARALVQIFQGEGSLLTATCYDSKRDLETKYPDANSIVSDLLGSNVTVFYQVDGTCLERSLPPNDVKFDKIVFNFPHTGMGIKDQARNIRANQELLMGFVKSSLHYMKECGELHITLKKGEPYSQWRVTQIAESTGILQLRTAIEFNPDNYPGYEHRRTLGFQEGLSSDTNEDITKGSQTYIFTRSKRGSKTTNSKRKRDR